MKTLLLCLFLSIFHIVRCKEATGIYNRFSDLGILQKTVNEHNDRILSTERNNEIQASEIKTQADRLHILENRLIEKDSLVEELFTKLQNYQTMVQSKSKTEEDSGGYGKNPPVFLKIRKRKNTRKVKVKLYVSNE